MNHLTGKSEAVPVLYYVHGGGRGSQVAEVWGRSESQLEGDPTHDDGICDPAGPDQGQEKQ